MDVQELLAAARSGDPHAVEELLHAVRPVARQWASALVTGSDAVEDVVQEALVEAWTSLESLREPEAFHAWLRLLVRKHADRHRRRLRPTAALDLVLDVPASEPGPESIAVRRDEDAIIRRALALAPDADRRLLRLRYDGGWTDRELAELLGSSPGAIRKRLYDARNRLRPALARDLDIHPSPTKELVVSNHLGAITEVSDGRLDPGVAEVDLTPLATGVRVLDALLPWPRAGLVDLIGPVGLGQLVLLGEVLTTLHTHAPSAVVAACSPEAAADGSSAQLPMLVEDADAPTGRSAVFRGRPVHALAAAHAYAVELAADGVTVLLAVDRVVADEVGLDTLAALPRVSGVGSVTVVRVAPWARDAAPVEPWGAAHTHIAYGLEQLLIQQYPAVDLLASTSQLADPEAGQLARDAVRRAAEVRNWIEQPFVTAERWTGTPGVRATAEQARDSLRAALTA